MNLDYPGGPYLQSQVSLQEGGGRRLDTGGEGHVTTRQVLFAGFEAEGRGQEPRNSRNAAIEAGKGNKTDSPYPLPPLGRAWPSRRPDPPSDPALGLLPPELQNNACVLF